MNYFALFLYGGHGYLHVYLTHDLVPHVQNTRSYPTFNSPPRRAPYVIRHYLSGRFDDKRLKAMPIWCATLIQAIHPRT